MVKNVKNIRSKSYKETTQIPDDLKNKLPTSYDIIGDIALIKLQNDLMYFKKEIGDAIISTHKNIRTVCLVKPVSGEFRTRKIEIIAGDKKTETCHREYGLNFYLDVKKTYFSPRLANERRRISELVKPNETVVDMFTGVAPFSIMIAKYAKPEIVFAVDKNKDAIQYAQKNITVNRVLDKIELIQDDAKKLVNILSKYSMSADRVIMNLPFSSYNFFETALKIIKNQATIHYYDIQHEDKIKERITQLSSLAHNNNFKFVNYNIKKIKSYSPHEFYIGIDITAKKQ